MKKSIAQSIGLLVLVGIAFVAGSVKAGNPATAPGAAFPNGNTPFPITVSSAMQIKGAGAPPASGGGLAVREFSVWQNASFDKEVGIQGILMGKTTSGNTSALSFGTTGNTVDVTTTGTTYTNGSMYAASLMADAGQLGLCANKAGEIVTCGAVATPVPTSTVTLVRTDSAYPNQSLLVVSGFGSDLVSYAANRVYQVPAGTYTMTARCDADPRVASNPQRDLNYPKLATISLTEGSQVTVPAGGNVTITAKCTCVYDKSTPQACL